MTSADDYINRVLGELPDGLPTRSQIAMELRAHIAERMASGRSLLEVVAQLGDPVKLAESYLSAEQLTAPKAIDRVAAKIIDVLVVMVVAGPLVALFAYATPGPSNSRFVLAALLTVCSSLLLWPYTVFAEFRYGRTLGKRALGLRVVRESGRRIGFGQAVVRQLPLVFQVIWVDALFALFTERSQRAFELLSKTRVVTDSHQEAV